MIACFTIAPAAAVDEEVRAFQPEVASKSLDTFDSNLSKEIALTLELDEHERPQSTTVKHIHCLRRLIS